MTQREQVKLQFRKLLEKADISELKERILDPSSS